jgi:orotidine-5'-phosphate decarboxylase
MNRRALVEQIKTKKSFLCVGLDTDISLIPKHLLSEPDPVFAFNKAIIDATKDYCVSYKINTAFYESRGEAGWRSMAETLSYIPKDIFTIADAKRGDIGNTANHYAKTFFETLPFHSITLSPYMGKDSIEPFLKYPDRWAILLGLTSNPGAADFQNLAIGSGGKVYEKVISTAATWGTQDNTMFVVGATRAEQLADIRKIIPDHFLLVPGVGAQGGSLEETAKYGMTNECGLLVNSSRAIIYADNTEKFAEAAGKEALKMQGAMAKLLGDKGIL